MPDQTTTPAVAVFDVNETLSNLDGLASRLEDAGGDLGVLPLWFATTLRDGFALTAAGAYAEFAEIAVPTLAALLSGADGLRGSPQEVAEHVVESMAELDLHPDVADGLRVFHSAGVRIVTLSNGSSRVAESLLERAGLRAGWLSRNGAPYPPYLRQPEATGQTLSELAAILTARAFR